MRSLSLLVSVLAFGLISAQINQFCNDNNAQYCKPKSTDTCQVCPTTNYFLTGCIDPTFFALTFIGGPWPGSANLLSMLNNKSPPVKATFFVSGVKLEVATNVATLQSINNDGHLIAAYTYSGGQTSGMSADQIRAEYTRTNDAINKAVGVRPRYARLPGPSGLPEVSTRNALLTSPACFDRLAGFNLDTRDYEFQANNNATGESDLIARFVAAQALNGNGKSIISLGSDQQTVNVAALSTAIDYARLSNKVFVKLDQCFGDSTGYINLATDPKSPKCDPTVTTGASSTVVPSMFLMVSLIVTALAFWKH